MATMGASMEAASPHNRMEQIFEAMRALRICWIVTLIAGLVLTVPPQVRDLYRTLAEHAQTDVASPKIAMTVLLLLLAAFLTYYVGRHRAFVHVSTVATAEPPLLAFCLRWGPPLCGTLLILAVGLGMFLTRQDVSDIELGIDPDTDQIIRQIKGTADYLGLAAIAAGILAFLFLIVMGLWSGRPRRSNRGPLDFAFDWPERILWLLAVGALVGMALYPQLSIPLSQSVGSMAIFLTFICLLLMGLSLLQTLSDRHGIPWVLVLMLWGTLLAVLDLNKPQIRLVPRPPVQLTQVTQQFEDWFRARKDRDAFVDAPYPVFLISAEAGGLYAAQFAAKVMARLQDQCPSFAQHVFAVSGVSGGSLGAAIFSSLARQDARNAEWQPCKTLSGPVAPKSFEGKVNTILRNDFLSPILARALFADLMQHALPTQLPRFIAHRLPDDWHGLSSMYQRTMAQLSRGRALDETIIQAWAAQTPHESGAHVANQFQLPFLRHWQPDSVNPALMLNTTSVNDGRQVFIAPFNMDGGRSDYESGLLYEQAFPRRRDVSLATAVSLSGRFPWILPATTVGNNQFALVDGAYFESSGIETLALVRNALRQYEVKPAAGTPEFPYVRIYVIVIGSFTPPVDDSPLVLDEATPPIRTLLKARDRRGYNAYGTLRGWDGDVQCPPQRPETKLEGQPSCTPIEPVTFRLNYAYFNLPLGWTLSDGVSRIIEQHVHGRCRDNPDQPDEPSSPRRVLEDNKLSAEGYIPFYLTPRSKLGPTAMHEPCPNSRR